MRKRLEDEGKYNQEISSIEEPSTTNDDILYFVMDKYKATCQRQENGYLLLKGSQISKSFSNSCRNSLKKLREKYSSSISDDFILIEDILFNSSSTAAEFVAGTSKNGKLYWKTKDGILLKDLLEKGE